MFGVAFSRNALQNFVIDSEVPHHSVHIFFFKICLKRSQRAFKETSSLTIPRYRCMVKSLLELRQVFLVLGKKSKHLKKKFRFRWQQLRTPEP